ncbi:MULTISPECIES: homoserine dehydrogenase [Methanoculleus]|uniref:Homoserine dehydrogenase n=1 Tax=Methanoculleus thermophilus TaxID=2200 RepID=A0A1G8YKV5_9EURY|nr:MULTISPECIES: homoserine dehydrogenase [Methanoculleus]NLN08033.1 homoserine dehydrogenase [Methanoculleus thermophilus]SDK03499.1 homoserine dehydrogenase [Methanoculleus thermophilus]HQD25510.1 homoserine dehydrogenase [Methanoculleus thermophilus]
MRIAILGFGSVGQGVARALLAKDLNITVTGLADSKSGIIDAEGIDLAAALDRKGNGTPCGNPGISPMDVVAKADYDVLVEVTPTNVETAEPALSHIRAALQRHKHVVTSNKGPIAIAYPELRALAEKNGVFLKYEATVCGAIPLIHALQEGLAGNTISRLYGVFNGTCNYILTRMAKDGLTYEQALAEARELGYAEADPTYDVEGIDAAIKLVILANTILDMQTTLDDVERTGITLLTPDALRLAEDQDCTIRLIGEIVPETGVLRVSPRLIPKDHPLVVEGTLNAVTVETDLAGDLTFIGRGAGSTETASAVIGDLLYLRNRHVQGS